MIAEVYRIRPWEMCRLTHGEWDLIVRDVKEKDKQARKAARSQ